MTIQKTYDSRSFLRLSELHHGTKWIIKLLLFLNTLPYATAQLGGIPPPPLSEPFSLGPKFNPSMAIIMIVLVSAFFFMGFFSVYFRQCAERRLRGTFDPALLGGNARRSRRALGLDEAIIETFPTFLYSTVKGLKIGKDSLECAVCLNEFEDDETLRLLPKCSHVFHPDCIDSWLANHTTCPVCRGNLVPKPGEIICATIQIPDSDNESEPVRRPDSDDPQDQVLIRVADDHSGETQAQSPGVNLLSHSVLTNQNRPPRSRSTGLRFTALFPRSHSTGHSLVQPGENCERFTLRLPEEVRSRIMNSALPRTKSCVAFPRVRSSRRGFRSASGGSGRGKNYFNLERFDRDVRPDRWGFTMSPPFISRTGSVRSQKVAGDSDEVVATPPKALFKSVRSVRSPMDRLFIENDDMGERSSDRLMPDKLGNQV